MAWDKVTHTGTPGNAGNGLGTHIRATLAGDAGFSTNWTVHPEVLFGATTTERSYFVLEHVNGLQVLVYVGNGTSALGTSGIHSTYLFTGFTTSTAQTIWMAIDPVGGGSGTGSFYDKLNVIGTDPNLIGFWSQDQKSPAIRAVEWFVGSGVTNLHFVYNTSSADLVLYTLGAGTGRLKSISVVALGENLIDGSDRPVEDRLASSAGIMATQADTDSGLNDVVEYVVYLFPELGSSLAEYSYMWDTADVDDRFRMVDTNTGAEPDGDGNYLSQSIVVSETEYLAPIRGIINFDMARHLVSISTLIGKERNGGSGSWMCAPVEMAFRWDGSGNLVA